MRQLAEAGHHVTVLSRSAARVAAVGVAGVDAAVADALDTTALQSAVVAARPDAVINQLTSLARTANPVALLSGLRRTSELRTLASGTLAQAARDAGAQRLVAQSVSFMYRPAPGLRSEADPLWTDAGGQVGRLARSLATLEERTLSEGLDGVVLRYGYFYGPGTYIAPDGAFVQMIRHRMFPVPVGGGSIFPFVHVEDAARATVAALDGPTGVFNVVDDVPAPLSDWVPFLADLVGARPPRRLRRSMIRAAGSYASYMLTGQAAVSNGRARGELGWTPVFADWHDGFRAVLPGS